MLLDQLEILFLSMVQGVFEFLPVSSTAHLILFSKDENLLIDISLHLGSLLAILFFFKKDFFNLKKNKNLFINILIATIPLLPFGYFLHKTGLIHDLRNIKIIPPLNRNKLLQLTNDIRFDSNLFDFLTITDRIMFS